MGKNIFYILVLILSSYFFFILGRNSVHIPEYAITKDTVYIEKPIPNYIEKIKTEYITSEKIKSDSIPINIERKIYQDTTYKAIISGPSIGGFYPTLEEITIYNKNKILNYNSPIISPYISVGVGINSLGVGGGIMIKDKIGIGAKYTQIGMTNALMLEVSYKF